MTKPLIGLICLLVLFITVACSSPPAEDTPTPTAAPATQTPIPPTVPNVQPQGTPIPAPSAPPPAATITPANLVALFDLRIRSGPGIEYPITDKFAKDEQAFILGRTAAGDLWYRIACPARLSAEECWVIGDPKVVRTVNAQNIAVAAAPPLSTTPATATPTPCVPDPPSDWTQYTIVAGDTLSGLANQSAGSIAQLQAVNCLESDTIVAGSRIYVPRPAVANVDGESGATGSTLPASAIALSSAGKSSLSSQPSGPVAVVPSGNSPPSTVPDSSPTSSSADGTTASGTDAFATPQAFTIDFTTTPPSGAEASLIFLIPTVTPVPTPSTCDTRTTLTVLGELPFRKGGTLYFAVCLNGETQVDFGNIEIVGPDSKLSLPNNATSWFPMPADLPGLYTAEVVLDNGARATTHFRLEPALEPLVIVAPQETAVGGAITIHLFGFQVAPKFLHVYAFTGEGMNSKYRATITISAAVFNENQEGSLSVKIHDRDWLPAAYVVTHDGKWLPERQFSITDSYLTPLLIPSNAANR